jgi:DHA2 family multidrug resistance protein
LIAFGWLSVSLAMFYSTRRLDLEISFGFASFLRITQVFGLAFLFVPINLVGFVGMPLRKSNSVAGIVNFMRNIGSSVGTSMVTTLLARRSQVHQAYLVAYAGPGQPSFTQAAAALASRLTSSGFDGELAARKAYSFLYQGLAGQAITLAYIDTYGVLAIGAAIMFVLSFALKKNQPGSGRVSVE